MTVLDGYISQFEEATEEEDQNGKYRDVQMAIDRSMEDNNIMPGETHTDPEQWRKSREAELIGILALEALAPISWDVLTTTERAKRISSRIIDTVKRDGTQKSRQVVGAGRRRQDPTDYNKKQGELHSPTIDWKTAQTVIAIAAKKGWTVQTTDIASAYLRAPMPDATSKEGKKFRRILEMPENIADMVIRLNKENGYRFFHKDELKKDDRGALYFHIKGALYGTLEAGRQWFEMIGHFLEKLGMTRTVTQGHLWDSLFVFGGAGVGNRNNPCVLFDHHKYGGLGCWIMKCRS